MVSFSLRFRNAGTFFHNISPPIFDLRASLTFWFGRIGGRSLNFLPIPVWDGLLYGVINVASMVRTVLNWGANAPLFLVAPAGRAMPLAGIILERRSLDELGSNSGGDFIDIGQSIDRFQITLGVVITQQRRSLFVIFHQPLFQAFGVVVSPALKIGRAAI